MNNSKQRKRVSPILIRQLLKGAIQLIRRVKHPLFSLATKIIQAMEVFEVMTFLTQFRMKHHQPILILVLPKILKILKTKLMK